VKNLELLMAEVNNTLADYWLDASNQCKAAVAKSYATPKVMRGSPYVELALQYGWILIPPKDRLLVYIDHGRSEASVCRYFHIVARSTL
jgi:DUF1365 family protein